MIQKIVFDNVNTIEQESINKIYSLNEVLGEYESYIPGDEMNQLVWYDDRNQTTVIYIDDFIIDLSYFLINNLEECQLEIAINKIEAKVKLLNLDQITNTLNQTSLTAQEYIYYIKCLVITLSESSNYHPTFFDILCKALKHPDEVIRYHSIFALSYLDWLQFIPFLEELLPNESHPDVKKAIQRLLVGYKKNF